VREKKEGRDVEAEVASEVSTAAEKGQRQPEGAKDALEVVENIAAVVVVTGLDRRMKTVSSSRLVTNPSQGEEVAEVAANVVNVANGVVSVVESGEVKEVSTAVIAETEGAETAQRLRELLSRLSNNSNHNNE